MELIPNLHYFGLESTDHTFKMIKATVGTTVMRFMHSRGHQLHGKRTFK